MPTDTIEAATALSREQLRKFHLTGIAPGAVSGTLRPAILAKLTDVPAYEEAALLPLHASALAQARGEQRTRFWNDVRHTHDRLREVLAVDSAHAPGAISAESVQATLGDRVSSFFKPNLLAKALQRPANPLRSMDPARRSRCESIIAALREALHDAANDPELFVFHSAGVAYDSIELRAADCKVDDSFAAALELCETRLNRLTDLLRTMRMAKLEIDSAFDPRIHDDMLSRFDWESASAEELAAIPPIVVWESAGKVAQASLTSFGRLLRSGFPVQILISRPSITPEDLRGFSPDLGYLAMAHRETYVLQSSLAELSHLTPGLLEMAKTQRTAVAVISEAADQEDGLGEVLAVWSRTHALYSYNPEAGPHWLDRFRLSVPPAVEVHAAHAAAVMPQLRGNFLVIPAAAWNSEQMELSDYFAAYQSHPPLAIPFIWVEDVSGGQSRALLTRDLANFCVDRQRAWVLFEFLGGSAKAEAPPDPEAARKEGATEALQQVIAMLQSAE